MFWWLQQHQRRFGTIAARSNECKVVALKLEFALCSPDSLCFLCISRASGRFVCSCSQFFILIVVSRTVMESFCSSVSTVPGCDRYFEHNVWSFMLEMDLAKISCQFVLDFFCCKGGCGTSCMMMTSAPLPMEFFMFLGPLPP